MEVQLKIKVENSVEKCIYLAGSKQINLAQKLGKEFNQQTISRWKKQGFIPPKHHKLVKRVFGEQITEIELMNDFYKAQELKQEQRAS